MNQSLSQAIREGLCIGPLNEVETRLRRSLKKFIANTMIDALAKAETEGERKLIKETYQNLIREESL